MTIPSIHKTYEYDHFEETTFLLDILSFPELEENGVLLFIIQ